MLDLFLLVKGDWVMIYNVFLFIIVILVLLFWVSKDGIRLWFVKYYFFF